MSEEMNMKSSTFEEKHEMDEKNWEEKKESPNMKNNEKEGEEKSTFEMVKETVSAGYENVMEKVTDIAHTFKDIAIGHSDTEEEKNPKMNEKTEKIEDPSQEADLDIFCPIPKTPEEKKEEEEGSSIKDTLSAGMETVMETVSNVAHAVRDMALGHPEWDEEEKKPKSDQENHSPLSDDKSPKENSKKNPMPEEDPEPSKWPKENLQGEPITEAPKPSGDWLHQDAEKKERVWENGEEHLNDEWNNAPVEQKKDESEAFTEKPATSTMDWMNQLQERKDRVWNPEVPNEETPSAPSDDNPKDSTVDWMHQDEERKNRVLNAEPNNPKEWETQANDEWDNRPIYDNNEKPNSTTVDWLHQDEERKNRVLNKSPDASPNSETEKPDSTIDWMHQDEERKNRVWESTEMNSEEQPSFNPPPSNDMHPNPIINDKVSSISAFTPMHVSDKKHV